MAIKLNGTGGMSLFHGTQARRHRFLGGVTMIETKSVARLPQKCLYGVCRLRKFHHRCAHGWRNGIGCPV